MNTNKTLADVQPGGRVRLGDQAERARFEAFLSGNPLTALCAGTAWEVWKAALSAQPSQPSSLDLEAMLAACVPGGSIVDPQVVADNIRHWFSAQPSPGGQGDAREREGWRKMQKAAASQTRKDGVGACDALYELAVKHGANDAEAAGFAHHVNGSLALLETQTHDGLHREATMEAALAARQPVELITQKVGDYRVTVAENAITVSRGRDIVFAYSAGDAEPINASQPVGQIVGYMDPNADFMLARPGDCVLMGNIVLWREPGSKYTKPLYDAPPAQAVDLSTLERFECQLYENPWPYSKMDEVDGGDWVRFDDVKALIDSQAVGK